MESESEVGSKSNPVIVDEMSLSQSSSRSSSPDSSPRNLFPTEDTVSPNDQVYNVCFLLHLV